MHTYGRTLPSSLILGRDDFDFFGAGRGFDDRKRNAGLPGSARGTGGSVNRSRSRPGWALGGITWAETTAGMARMTDARKTRPKMAKCNAAPPNNPRLGSRNFR